MKASTLLFAVVATFTFIGSFTSCCREPLYDPIEADNFELVVVPRWIELEHRPTGMTVMIYPTDGREPITVTSNNVDSVSTFLPAGNYKILCFNQTESEYSSFYFRHMESFSDCEIVCNEDPQHLNAFNIFPDSRMCLQPEILVVDYYTSLSVTQEQIDGAYHKGKKIRKIVTLTPHEVVSTLYITVPVNGIYNAYSVSGCIDGMAKHLFMSYYESGTNRASHVISNWVPHYESVSSNKGTFTASCTTLGLPGMSLHLTPSGYEETQEEDLTYGTRPSLDPTDPIFQDKDIRFHMKVLLRDLKTVVDTTYLVGDLIKRRDNFELILDLDLSIDINLPYVDPADGSKTAGFDVDVDDWVDEQHIIDF